MFTHILLASDGSECALQAAEVAAALASTFASRLTIINVFQPSPYIAPYAMVTAIGQDDAFIGDMQENAICSAGRIADTHNVPYQRLKEIGNPAAQIVHAAEEEACDLIVLGSRGLNAAASFFFGSVSDRVTHHAHCPVLIVR